ncbi:MAG: hypothetical protein GX900_00190 [Clostridiaceae bacterium]|nr:hypothetical protein [Clostridiaceae bacterium]
MPHLFVLVVSEMTFTIAMSVLSIIITVAGLYYLISNRAATNNVFARIMRIDQRLTALEGCRIENLPAFVEICAEEDWPLMNQAVARMSDDCEHLYNRDWISDPSNYLNRENLVTRRQYQMTGNEVPMQILAISVLGTAALLLLTLSAEAVGRAPLLRLSLIPFIVGIIFAALLYFASKRQTAGIDRALKQLSVNLSRRVPVFSDLSGSAILVDYFLQYDRKMTGAVERLSATVDGLINNQLAESVSNSLSDTLQNGIIPPINQAADTLGDLAGELTRRQSEGMDSLAATFSDRVSEHLRSNLDPVFTQLRDWNSRMENSVVRFDENFAVMQKQEAHISDLNAAATAHLENLLRQQEHINESMREISGALGLLSEVSSKMAALQEGSEKNLSGKIDDLSTQLRYFADASGRVMDGLVEENRRTGELIGTTTQAQEQSVLRLGELAVRLEEQAATLQAQSDLLNRTLSDLNETLNSSVANFTGQLENAVESTLNDFDEGLADVTGRLSATTLEISDSVEAIAGHLRQKD